MPTQPFVQNNFTAGLKTEFTGLNFPENAATDTSDCTYTLIGDVIRRQGLDLETNFTNLTIDPTLQALSSYKWNNVGGDGNTQLIVEQIGTNLYFYTSSAASIASPLSTQKLASTVDLTQFLVVGSSNPIGTVECQYTDGNGYLFVFHPALDSFYCTYTSGVITANLIPLQIRDFSGIVETGILDNFRPITLTNEHKYNLVNQGWTAGSAWTLTSATDTNINTGSHAFTVNSAGAAISNGDLVQIYFLGGSGTSAYMTGNVTSYVSTTLTVNVTAVANSLGVSHYNNWTIVPLSTGYINTWLAAIGNYPSNSDVWWSFKNSTGTFDPATMLAKISLGLGPAPKGHFVLPAFNLDRSTISGVLGLTAVATNTRPKTGAWFQGRVWYAGVDASFPASGDAVYNTWTEDIYFSQVVENVSNFGKCYQTNDPTSENLFALLPTDGGVIKIQGSGSVYKLFPIQTGLFVFAANGVWFISGNAGVGFSANDYTIIKVSGVQSISGTSFVNVLGWPVFWNEEGIYEVVPQGTSDTQNNRRNFFQVNNLALGNILTYYANIPLQSKKFVRGDYNPLDYVVQWCFRDTNETNVTTRYQYNKILNFNTANKAFYPWSIGSSNSAFIHDIRYVAGPGGVGSSMPMFKYWLSYTSGGLGQFTFAEEKDNTHYVDWFSLDSTGVNFTSYFISGYNLEGKALTKFQVPYVYVFSRNSAQNKYIIQSIWDYASTGNSGRWSVQQLTTNNIPNYSMVYRKHRLRGRGIAVQIKIKSVAGQPFDIMGWSMWNQTNQGI